MTSAEVGLKPDPGDLGTDPILQAGDFERVDPVTESQRELWLAAALGPQVNIAFNEGLVWTLEGDLDAAALERAVQQIVARHDSLRACFTADGRSMCVRRELAVRLPVTSLEGDPAESLKQAARKLTGTSLDLERGPLFRFELYRAGPTLHHLLFIAHHIVCDGWSYKIIGEELCTLYNAAKTGTAAALPQPQHYADYARREKEFLDSPRAKECLDFWLEALRDPPAPLALPSDQARPARRTYEAARYDHRLPADLTAALRQFAVSQRVSLVTALFGAFGTLAHRLTGDTDLLIGIAAAGQTLHELPQLVGHCVHFIPLRLKPTGAMTVRDFFKQARGAMLDAVEHQGLTYGTLLRHLPLKRDPSRPPLISIALNCDGQDAAPAYDGLQVTSDRIHRQAENFELFLNIVDDGRGLVLQCSYNTALFSAAAMRSCMQQFETVLAALPKSADDATLAQLPLGGGSGFSPTTAATDAVLKAEAVGLKADPRATQPIPDGTLHQLIEQQAERTPDAIAVECGGERWSYVDLLARADAIAAALQARGIKPGDFVGVCLRRTAQLPAALIAVLKCGAAYVPLDPDLPAARLLFMFQDARAKLLLCEDATMEAFEGEPRLMLEDVDGKPVGLQADPQIDPLSPAYAIYTSGSTGQPKGVIAHHRGVLNCLEGTRARIGLAPGDALLAIATYAFDASILEIFMPLVYGAKLVIATEDETQDGALLARAIERHGITRIFTAPAAWRLLIGAGWEGKSDLVGISWAEPLTPELARALLPRLQSLWNLYGPTETTVWMLGTQILDTAAPITIGTPIPNTHAYILDEQRQPVAAGVTGELYIGGACVTLGYLNRPELTAERFVDDPFNGGRMYKTGDLARFTANGEVECLGRADLQVKLRGYRIELAEVEAALRQCAGVDECACGVRNRAAGDARLVAWVVLKPEVGATVSELRQELRERLPSYMVPQHFRVLEAMPRLPNGKLDRQGLPDPFAQADDAVRAAPQTDAEKRVADIWHQVLGHGNFGVNDRFLDVGGHSLLAVEVALKLRDAFGAKLLLREVLTDPLAQLASSIADSVRGRGHDAVAEGAA